MISLLAASKVGIKLPAVDGWDGYACVLPEPILGDDQLFNSAALVSSVRTQDGWNILWLPRPDLPASDRIAGPQINLLSGLLGNSQIVEIETGRWRSTLADNLRTWIEDDSFTQRDFWPVVEYAVNNSGMSGALTALSATWRSFDVSFSRVLDSANCVPSVDYDFAFTSTVHCNLSSAKLRSIMSALLEQIEASDTPDSLGELINQLRQTVISKVFSECQWSIGRVIRTKALCSCNAPSTHDWVLSFKIHTGSSPPDASASRLASGWALGSITNVLVDHYEQIRRRRTSPNLQHAFCSGRTGKSVDTRSRNFSAIAGSMYSARYWDHWSDHPLA
jgi:hypothetical protein